MDRRTLVGVLALLAVLAGCSTAVPAGGDGAAAPATTEGGPLTPAGGETVRMTVTRVVDGDTMNVEFDNGIEDTVRLLGVDTPETRSENTPDEWEGVPDTAAGRECLDRYGDRATAFATEALEGREVTFHFDPEADRRGSFGRLLGYFVVDGRNFNHQLVREGHARVFDSEFSLSGSFYAAEEEARTAGRGAWACASDTGAGETPTATPDGGSVDGRLAVVGVNADAEGNDNENLNDEYVVLENVGDESLDLSGWTVTDAAGREYTFPEGTTLDPGARVTLHTGSGTDSATDLYWGQSSAVWNNDGDTVTVRDAGGEVVAEREY